VAAGKVARRKAAPYAHLQRCGPEDRERAVQLNHGPAERHEGGERGRERQRAPAVTEQPAVERLQGEFIGGGWQRRASPTRQCRPRRAEFRRGPLTPRPPSGVFANMCSIWIPRGFQVVHGSLALGAGFHAAWFGMARARDRSRSPEWSRCGCAMLLPLFPVAP